MLSLLKRKKRAKRDRGEANFLEGALTLLLHQRGQLNIVQIGANDGKIGDPLHNFAMKNREKTSIILVEPQAELIPYLEKNYKDHKKAYIENIAIGSKGELILYRIKPEQWKNYKTKDSETPEYRRATGITSARKDYVLGYAKKNIRDFTDANQFDFIEELKVPCLPLENVLAKHKMGDNIDLLQVDVEGEDDNVLFSSDLEQHRPRLINYEYKHLSEERQIALENYLDKIGYTTITWSGSDKLSFLKD